MLFGHIDYFELKTLVKQQMHGGHPSFFLLEAGDEVPYGRCPTYMRRKETFLTPGMRSRGQEKFVQTNLLNESYLSSHLSIINYPSLRPAAWSCAHSLVLLV